MNGSGIRITTGEAAEIVHVHESTVKRWCDAGELDADVTRGGHRRIKLKSLLQYAKESGLDCELLAFGPEAQRTYSAYLKARKEDFGPAAGLLYHTAKDGDATRVAKLLMYLTGNGLTAARVCDEGLAPVLRGIGQGWAKGTLTVGDEHRMSAVFMDALYALRHENEKRRSQEPSAPEGRRAVVGCLAGNFHVMGATLVRLILESSGWEVVFLGADVPMKDFADQQRRTECALVCVSLTAPQVASDGERAAETLAAFYARSHPYRLAIGGAPTRRLACTSLQKLPFEDCQSFTSLRAFTEWL